MARFDFSLDELHDYRPSPAEPADLDEFWAGTLAEAREAATAPAVVEVRTGLRSVATFDVTFSGYGGQPVKAWLNRPAGVTGPLPVVVEFIGYGGGRGLPHEWLFWSSAGYAHLVMDSRGQGGIWRAGDTPDPDPVGSGPSVPGFMTRGVLDPATYYYRRIITDAVRAVETVAELPGVDPARVVATGMSQGGALSIAAAGLVPDRVAVLASGVPFLCDIRRAITITDEDPFAELVRFMRTNPHRAEAVLATVDYVDSVHFARRVTAPALFSTALMDFVCPPSGVFAAYNAHPGEPSADKEIQVYEWDGHAGGRAHWDARALDFVGTRLGF